jgi:hypothetical protein
MKNTYTMSEPCVSRARIDEFGEAQLLYPPQALERFGLNDVPHRALKLIVGELDEVMEGVSYSMSPSDRHSRISLAKEHGPPCRAKQTNVKMFWTQPDPYSLDDLTRLWKRQNI